MKYLEKEIDVLKDVLRDVAEIRRNSREHLQRGDAYSAGLDIALHMVEQAVRGRLHRAAEQRAQLMRALGCTSSIRDLIAEKL